MDKAIPARAAQRAHGDGRDLESAAIAGVTSSCSASPLARQILLQNYRPVLYDTSRPLGVPDVS